MRRPLIALIVLAIALVAATAMLVSRDTDPLRLGDRGEVAISFGDSGGCPMEVSAAGLSLVAWDVPQAWYNTTKHGRLIVTERASENWVKAEFQTEDGIIALGGNRADRPLGRSLGC